MDNVFMWAFIKSISGNIDSLTLSVTILLAVIGWIFALWLQQKGTKQQHKIQVRYEIYKQFVHLHKEVQDAISKLSARSSPPFILMESSMIPFTLGLKKEYKDVWLPYNEQECVFEGEKKWTAFTQELYAEYSKFSEKLIQFSYIFEDWEGALEPLLPTKRTLGTEIEKQKKIISQQLSELQSYTSRHSHDWRKWDQKEVETITQLIKDSSMTITSYLSDFMVLIHNELLSGYFGHERPTRKTLDPKYKVLTKDGVVENVDHKLVENMEKWKTELKSLAPSNCQEVTDNTCSQCGTEIFVIESNDLRDGTYFGFACGHSLTINNEETTGKNKS